MYDCIIIYSSHSLRYILAIPFYETEELR